MTASIRPLDVDLVHRIAAGEVIDSLAAVVRELIDNALDAGATRIDIALWPQAWRVQVADNGCGLSQVDLQQAAAPHTTSKLHARDDLWRIGTLGFRGEALHSLTQVGKLEICSRPSGAAAGWQAVYDDQGQVVQMLTIAIAPGTVITVDQIFADWSARKQALPKPAQQMRAVQAVIHEYALCHPGITWQARQNDRAWFGIAPGTTAQDILPQILATVQPGDLRYLQLALPQVHDPFQPQDAGPNHRQNHLEVVVGLPDRCHRRRPDWVRVGVNGRCVQVSGEEGTSTSPLRPIEQTILGAFRQTLPRHRYPLCFVHLHVDPTQVDWNRHPAKTEIYLHDLEGWRQQVAQAIQQALQIPVKVVDTGHLQKVRQLIKAAETKGVYHLQQSSSLASHLGTSGVAEEDAESFPTLAAGFSVLRAIAQLHQTYIVAEHPTGMWLVEQHIAHERVLYERLCQDWRLTELTPPLMLRDLTDKQVAQLDQIGLEIEAFGHSLWAVRSAPKLLAQRSDCEAALLELSQCVSLEAALVATACRSAIRNGTPLTQPEMQTLLNEWQRTKQPRTCPHGRPIYLSLEETELARFFRRHWVIGKSHGI